MTHVKGALSQTLLQAAEARLHAKTYAAFEALAAVAIREVRATSSLGWLPLTTHMQILDALTHLGTVAMVADVNAHMMVLLADKPILRPLKEAAFRRNGASPTRLLHLAPSIWPLLVRGVGTVVYEPTSEFSGVYRLLSVPPAGLVPAWTHAIAGSLRGVIEVSRCDGTVTLQVDERAKSFSVTLEWKSRM